MKVFDLNKFKSRRSGVKIKYIEENGKRYAIRDGKHFEVRTLDRGPPPKTKRKAFKPKFAQLPMRWVEALERNPNGNAYSLAVRIQLEKFRRERTGGEIVLSAEVTGMSSANRHRAANELERLGLIKLSRDGHQAFKVTIV